MGWLIDLAKAVAPEVMPKAGAKPEGYRRQPWTTTPRTSAKPSRSGPAYWSTTPTYRGPRPSLARSRAYHGDPGP